MFSMLNILTYVQMNIPALALFLPLSVTFMLD